MIELRALVIFFNQYWILEVFKEISELLFLGIPSSLVCQYMNISIIDGLLSPPMWYLLIDHLINLVAEHTFLL